MAPAVAGAAGSRQQRSRAEQLVSCAPSWRVAQGTRAVVMCAMVFHVAAQASTNVTTIVGLGLPPAECLYWNDGTHSGRAPFCERFSDGLICSGAWDPECVWRVLGILNELVDEVPNADADRDGLSDVVEGRATRRDSDNDLIPDYLDTDGNANDIRDSLEDFDGDGIPNGVEGSGDADADGVPNSEDLDSDGDGIPDRVEGSGDSNGNGVPDFREVSTNPCTGYRSIRDMQAQCAGTMPYVPNVECADGKVSGATCAPVGFPEAVCTWTIQLCPSFPYSVETACGGAHGRGIGAPDGPCLNGGLCEPWFDGEYVLDINRYRGVFSYTCVCFNGWGGANCEYLVPIDCVGDWRNWTDCNATCGGGFQTRNYTVTVPAMYGGVECDMVHGDNQTQDCNMEACPEPEPEPEPEPSPPPPDPTSSGSQATDKAALLATKTDRNSLVGWSEDSQPCDGGWHGVRCHSAAEAGRVVFVSIGPGFLTSAVDVAGFVGVAALMHLNLHGNSRVRGNVACLGALHELRYLNLRQTSVHGLISSLDTLLHLGDCWAPFEGWEDADETDCTQRPSFGLYGGGLYLADTGVFGDVTLLQALPHLGKEWNIRLDGSYTSCSGYSGFFTECEDQQLVDDSRNVAGRDACVCCRSLQSFDRRCRDYSTGECTVANICPGLPHCVGSWGNWSECNTTCGGGVEVRNYSVTVPAYACGKPCEVTDGTSQLQQCNIDPCPPPPPPFAVDCEGRWSNCTEECEMWNSRTWEETSVRAGRGAACPAPTSCRPGEGDCPDDVDCQGTWSHCTAMCEPAMDRSWDLAVPRSGNGASCPLATSCQPGEGDCPEDVDCTGVWTNCTTACEAAIDRNFTVITVQSGNGDVCPQSTSCQPGEGECPIDIDCEGAWSNCTEACEPAQHRTWDEVVARSGNGAACPRPTTCQAGEGGCPIDAVIVHFDCLGSWSSCTPLCEPSFIRTWTETQAQGGLGALCPEAESCRPGDGECPANVDCKGFWSECTALCEIAASRTFTVTTPRSGRGSRCPFPTSCRPGDGGCPRNIDCVGAWANCTEQCELAENRTWSELVPHSGRGSPCPVAEYCRPGEDDCPPNIDCVGLWSFCTEDCEKAANRTFSEVVAPSGKGAPCPPRANCVTGDGNCVLYCDMFVCSEIGTMLVDDPADIEGMDAETCCQVDLNICRANKHVVDHACRYCPIGTTNEMGDDLRGTDTACDETVCQVNQYVLRNMCVSCAGGFSNEPGDLASGSDTACAMIPITGMCTGNTNRSQDAMCLSQGDPAMLHKPDSYTISCGSDCSSSECCDPMPTEPPELLYMWEATAFPRCAAHCGMPLSWPNFTRTVRCMQVSRYSTGALMREEAANSSLCTEEKPKSIRVCNSILAIGDSCDDNNPSTSNDRCMGQLWANATCVGTVHLASSVMIPVAENALADDAVPAVLASDAMAEVQARQIELLSNPIAMLLRARLAEALGVQESAIVMMDMVFNSGDRRRRLQSGSEGITFYFVVSVHPDQVDAVRAAARGLTIGSIIIPAEAAASGHPITIDNLELDITFQHYAYFRTGTCPFGLPCSNRCGVEEITSADVWTCTEDGVPVIADVCLARGLGPAPETSSTCCPAASPDTCIASARDLMPPAPEPEPPEPEPEPEPPPVDCVGSWGNWSDCNATCGGGVQQRNYSVAVRATGDGAQCHALSGASEMQNCSLDSCPPELDTVLEEHWWPFSPMETYIIAGGGSGILCLLLICCCWAIRKCRKAKYQPPSRTPQQEMKKVMNVAKAAAKLKKPIRERQKAKEQIDHLAAARAAQEARERAAAERRARDEERARLLAEEEAAARAAAEEEARRRAERKRLRDLERARLAGLSARERWRETQMSERERARIVWKDLQADSGPYTRRVAPAEVQDYRENDFVGGAKSLNLAPLTTGGRAGRALEP